MPIPEGVKRLSQDGCPVVGRYRRAGRLSDLRGEALRVYARVVDGKLQVALAVRSAVSSATLR